MRRNLRTKLFLWSIAGVAVVPFTVFALRGHGESSQAAPGGGTHVVFAYNELGMHCMNQDFSELCILPPYNVLRAQVIQRGGEPHIVTSGVSIKFSIPSNTHSIDKTNFWAFDQPLFGVNLAPNIGLTGNGMSGGMTPNPRGDWEVTGIPITPLDDSGRENPFPLASVIVRSGGGGVIAQTQAVVPVSWEISCNICHNSPGISTETDILRKHDSHNGTDLEHSKPVLCASCHADNALGTSGQPGVKNLSRAMHSFHAPVMAQANLDVDCYACHPGQRTQCQRDVHYAAGMRCGDCHGTMADVGAAGRNPWVDEPRCGNCHHVAGHQYEQAGVLYKNAKGHSGVQCMACHGSTHAIGAAVTDTDNVQAIELQGHAGVINTCIVCHTQQPGESFFHKVDD